MSGKTQKDKFKELAREAGCNEDEASFEEKLKRIAKGKTPKDVKTPNAKTERDD